MQNYQDTIVSNQVERGSNVYMPNKTLKPLSLRFLTLAVPSYPCNLPWHAGKVDCLVYTVAKVVNISVNDTSINNF